MTVSRETIRNVFLANGFTIKPGHDDLKPYVYDAAEMLLKLARVSLPVADAPHERESFEKHPNFRGMDFARAAGAPELYDSPYLNGAWDAWQVRAAMLSLRDVFARTAIESLLTRPFTKDEKGRPFLDWVSDAAYELADNMLAERGPEQGEQFEVAAVVCRSKDGDWYVDALHPSRFGESGYMEEGAELAPVSQCRRVLAGYEAAYQDRWEKARDLQSEMDGLVEELDAMRAALSAPPAAGVLEQMSPEARSTLVGMVELCLNKRYCMGMDLGFASFDPDVEHDFVKELRAFAEGAPTPHASEKQHDGRMPSDARNRMWDLIDVALLDTVPDGLKRGDICNTLAPLLASEQQQAVVVPDGWKAVPLEPTQEMFEAGRTSATGSSSEKLAMAGYYRAMLAAAPTPPASEQQAAISVEEAVHVLLSGGTLVFSNSASEQQQAVMSREYGEPIACPDCNGSGEWPHDRSYPCPRCSGDGVAEREASDAPNSSAAGMPTPGCGQ